jgi:hypothetical protein
MSGLRLGLGGGVKLGSSLGNQPPATISQTAYGQENAPTASGSATIEPWHLAVAVPVAALAWLAFLRWSLPN